MALAVRPAGRLAPSAVMAAATGFAEPWPDTQSITKVPSLQKIQDTLERAYSILSVGNLEGILNRALQALKTRDSNYIKVDLTSNITCANLNIFRKPNHGAHVYLYVPPLPCLRNGVNGCTMKQLSYAVQFIFDREVLVNCCHVARLQLNIKQSEKKFGMACFNTEARILSLLTQAAQKSETQFCTLYDASPAVLDPSNHEHEPERECFMYMPFYDGDMLTFLEKHADWQNRSNLLPLLPGLFLSILQQLYHAHNTLKIAHGDIKTDNLFFSGIGIGLNAVLGDWGSVNQTRGRTDDYKPPEHLFVDREGTPEGDIWSLGCTFLTLLNHSTPPWMNLFSILAKLQRYSSALAKEIEKAGKSTEAILDGDRKSQSLPVRENGKCEQSITKCRQYWEWAAMQSVHFPSLLNRGPYKPLNAGFAQGMSEINIFVQNELGDACAAESSPQMKQNLKQALDDLLNIFSDQLKKLSVDSNITPDDEKAGNLENVPTEYPGHPIEILLRQVVACMLRFDPAKRLTAQQILDRFGPRLSSTAKNIKDKTFADIVDAYRQVPGPKIPMDRPLLEKIYNIAQETISKMKHRLQHDDCFYHVEKNGVPPFDVYVKNRKFIVYLDVNQNPLRNVTQVKNPRFGFTMPPGGLSQPIVNEELPKHVEHVPDPWSYYGVY